MQYNLQLRAVARLIYCACEPSEEWALVAFDQAERVGKIHHRHAVGAAQQARVFLYDPDAQPSLFNPAHA